jgi:hydroxymethylpyrimidine pyrophosphatase-like HAD family hydrolase
MPRCRLLAIDLDGTLVRDDGVVAPEDEKAVARARKRGIAVTFATGRLGPAAVPLARALGLETPLICGDGAVTVCPRTAVLLSVRLLPSSALEGLIEASTAEALAPFLFCPHVVLAPPESAATAPLIGWAPRIVAREVLREAVLLGPGLPVVAAFAMGPEPSVRSVAQRIGKGARPDTEMSLFPIERTPLWAVRLTASGASKAAGLARVAESLGLSRSDVAVIGDWYNDVAMFRWARRSYVMGQAPEAVVRAARHRLRATSQTGGGVAEAIEHLLRDSVW